MLFWDKNGTHLDDVIKNTKIEKNHIFGEKIWNAYFTILHPINAKLLHCDDSECISPKFILEKYIQCHTKYTWF